MKRPLSTVIFAFLSGEALCGLINRKVFFGMAFAVLFLCVLLVVKKKGTGRYIVLLAVPFLCGGIVCVLLYEGYTAGNAERVVKTDAYEITTMAQNPGGFDKEAQATKPLEKLTSAKPVSEIKEYLANRLDKFADAETAGLMKGILLGEKGDMDGNLKKLYRAGGISHVLAISGLHVSLLGGGVQTVLLFLGVPFSAAGVFTILFMFLYGLLTGFGFSTARAVVMMFLSVLGSILGRSYDMITGAAVALLLVVGLNPARIYDIGLLLSFTAVLGICFGSQVIRRLKKRRFFMTLKRKHKLIYKLTESLIMTICLNLVLSPMVLYLYFELPVYAIFLNLIVCTLMPVVVGFGAVALLVSFVNFNAAGVALLPAKLVLSGYKTVLSYSLALPGSVVRSGRFSLAFLVIYYVLLAGALVLRGASRRKVRKGRVYIALAPVVLGVVMLFVAPYFSRREQIVMLNVGQGDGILVRMEGGACAVIDGGSVSKGSIGEYVMAPALKYYGMCEVDYWFVSHADTDHISGLLEIMEQGDISGIKIRNIVISAYAVEDENLRELKALADYRGIPVLTVTPGDYVQSGKSRMVCLFPGKDNVTEDKNEASLVLYYESSSFTALFTGDLGEESLIALVESINEEGRILTGSLTFLKVPHHGSKYSLCTPLYEFISPYGIAGVSSGKNNYGHPHELILQAIEEAGAAYLRTDRVGTVVLQAR